METSKFKLRKIDKDFYILGSYAKNGEYSLTCGNKIQKVDDFSRPTLWSDGYPSIIASTNKDFKIHLDVDQEFKYYDFWMSLERIYTLIDPEELSQATFTISDIRKSINFGAMQNHLQNYVDRKEEREFIKSLFPDTIQTEWDIEIEMVKKFTEEGTSFNYWLEPKINEKGFVNILNVK